MKKIIFFLILNLLAGAISSASMPLGVNEPAGTSSIQISGIHEHCLESTSTYKTSEISKEKLGGKVSMNHICCSFFGLPTSPTISLGHPSSQQFALKDFKEPNTIFLDSIFKPPIFVRTLLVA